MSQSILNRKDIAILELASSSNNDPRITTIEELAIGGASAKKDLLMANLTSSISFISPVAMLTMAALGTAVLGPVSLTVMGLFALMSTKGAWSKHKAVLYKAFFDPNDKLVIEFDDALKVIIGESRVLKSQYDQEMKLMFKALKDVPEQATKQQAKKLYRVVYRNHMGSVIHSVSKILPSLKLQPIQKTRFTTLVKQLKKARLI